MLGIADYGAFCAAILLFLALPGPGTLALLSATGQGGFRGGAAATAGLIAADQLLLWLAVAGMAALLAAHPMAFRALQWGGALYLAWVGWQLLRGGGAAAVPLRLRMGRFARQAFLITVLNPKALVFYMAFFPLFVDPARHQGLLTWAVMALTVAGISAAYCLGLCALAARLGGRLRALPRLRRWLERLAGAALIVFGIRLGTS